ncbi:MAG: GH3 auxin-responsive promoter family protein, partial [Bacteroidales bacterium]|nr:GH3 auxin-responsive promoter family protein [Bacteroidales bacterium]
MPIFRSIVSWMMIKRTNEINLFKNYPFEVQQETLQKLIKKAKDTEWGKKYDYKSINTIEEYKKRVPLQYYDDIKPYVIRLRQGEQTVLWNQEIKWFAKSSGTTNDKSKFIPVSKDALEDCHFRGAKDILTIYATHHPDTKIFKGKGLTIGGSHQINNFSNESYYGDLSAILIENAPFWT